MSYYASLTQNHGGFLAVEKRVSEQGQIADRQRSAWMAAAQAGDQTAYNALLRDCVGTIRIAARLKGVPDSLLDDVVQETLLTIHRARHTYDPARSFTAWLRALAMRRAIDILRQKGRRSGREVYAPLDYENYSETGLDPAQELERVDDAHELRRVIAGLPEGQRQAVEELALKERSLEEAALATGRNVGALKVNLHRALKSLRAQLTGESE